MDRSEAFAVLKLHGFEQYSLTFYETMFSKTLKSHPQIMFVNIKEERYRKNKRKYYKYYIECGNYTVGVHTNICNAVKQAISVCTYMDEQS